MVLVHFNGQMAVFTKVNGAIVVKTVVESSQGAMERFTRVNGSMENIMVAENFKLQMAKYLLVPLKTENS